VRVILQHGFPAEQAIRIAHNCDTACAFVVCIGAIPASLLPGGCTTLIKRSLVHNAYEQRFKE
jgi:hypothetical protein